MVRERQMASRFNSFQELSEHLSTGSVDENVALHFLLDAIEQESKDLAHIYRNNPEDNAEEAQENFLSEINTFLAKDKPFDPEIIMNWRRRPKTWAIAEKIKGGRDVEKPFS